jgi:pimeloyl-ACP methyl ester carboxylesterase
MRGRADLLLTQTCQVLHYRHWKLMIPYLSHHYRVVTYDPVGNGKSDRVFDGDRYGIRSQVDDAVAVLDATDTSAAIAVGLSRGGGIAVAVGAFHPARIDGVIAITPSHYSTVPYPNREVCVSQHAFAVPSHPGLTGGGDGNTRPQLGSSNNQTWG